MISSHLVIYNWYHDKLVCCYKKIFYCSYKQIVYSNCSLVLCYYQTFKLVGKNNDYIHNPERIYFFRLKFGGIKSPTSYECKINCTVPQNFEESIR